jgi:hypothetical protein
MGFKMANKFTLTLIDASGLIGAGVTNLRYAEIQSCDTDAATQNAASCGTNCEYPADSLALMNIPNHAFETPRPGSGRNRGRGFSASLNQGGSTTAGLLVWNRGDDGYNNVKVGSATRPISLATTTRPSRRRPTTASSPRTSTPTSWRSWTSGRTRRSTVTSPTSRPARPRSRPSSMHAATSSTRSSRSSPARSSDPSLS